MAALQKVFNLWRYYGTRGFFAKAEEKWIVDRRRFGKHQTGVVPVFPPCPIQPVPPLKQNTAPIEIWYLIHYFFPEKQGGAERFVLNQALEQQRRGNHVRVLTLSTEPTKNFSTMENGMWSRDYNYHGVSVTAFRYDKTPLGLYYKRIDEDDITMTAFANAQLANHRPDIVHCAYGQPMAAFLKVCRQEGIPYIITTTGFDSLCHYTTMVDKCGGLCAGSNCGQRCKAVCKSYGIADYTQRYLQGERYLRGAGALVAPSEYVARVLAADFNQLPVYVVHHGVSLSVPHNQNRTTVRRFAFVGTLTEIKGLPLLLSAFRQLPPDCTLSIYGDGNPAYVAQLKGAAKSDSRIQFCGPLPSERVSEAYANADCVVIPSLVPETYNFVLREALQCGCLVVAARIGAMPEAVIEHKNGFLFTAGDETALEAALQQACHFDWTDYVPAEIPSCQEESAQYTSIYSAQCTQTNLKKDVLS